MLTSPMKLHLHDRTLVCSACLRDGRAQRLRFEFICDWYVCLVHGPMVTSEFMWAVLPLAPTNGGESWTATR